MSTETIPMPGADVRSPLTTLSAPAGNEKHALIADDAPGALAYLNTVVNGILRAGWTLHLASDKDAALKVVKELGPNLKIAVVDLFLTDPPEEAQPEGLEVLRSIQKNAPDCFRILISQKPKAKVDKAEHDPSVQRFVSTRWIDTNPRVELESALIKAENYIAEKEFGR